MNPFMLVVAVIGGLSGGLATLYLVISMPAVIIWKIFRRITQGIPITK